MVHFGIHKRQRGFTIIEIAIAIAIMTAQSVVVYNNVQIQSRDTKRESDMRVLQTQLEKYYGANGKYPRSIFPAGPSVTSS